MEKYYNKAVIQTFVLVLFLCLTAACQGVETDTNGEGIEKENLSEIAEADSLFTATGRASYYADLLHGRPTANGELYDTAAFTAAHMKLPFGTRLKVTHLNNQRTVEVVVNDRGPFHPNRIIDLSKAAAKELRMLEKGTARVRITEIPQQ